MTQQVHPPSGSEQPASSSLPPARPTEPPPTGPSPLRLERGGDRRSLRVAAALILVGELVYAVAMVFHPDANDPVAAFVVYAGSRSWALVHATQFAAAAILTFGLVALVHGLNVNSGIRGLLNRFAAVAAVAGLALNGVLYAVDGAGLKQAIDTWISAPPGAQPALFAVVEGVRGVEWGLRGYVDFTFGLTLLLLAAVIVTTARVPRTIGYLMGLAGLLAIAQGVGYGGGYTAISPHFVLASSPIQAVVLIWTILLLVSVWRMKESESTNRRS